MLLLDSKKERVLLMLELDDYYNRLDIAERFDNYGDREWYREMIMLTESKLQALERAV